MLVTTRRSDEVSAFEFFRARAPPAVPSRQRGIRVRATPEVAHQIINTGTTTMRYLALSTLVDVDAAEFPDSQKVLIRAKTGLRRMFRAETTVDYYDREKPEDRP